MWGVHAWSMHVSMSMQFLPPQSQNAGALPDRAQPVLQTPHTPLHGQSVFYKAIHSAWTD